MTKGMKGGKRKNSICGKSRQISNKGSFGGIAIILGVPHCKKREKMATQKISQRKKYF